MNLSKIVKSVVVGLPFVAAIAAAPNTHAGLGLNATVMAAAGAPVAPFFGGGASSFANWKITFLGAVANIDPATRSWVVPLVSADTISDKFVTKITGTALCSTGSTAQLYTTDAAGNLLSANSPATCVTGTNTFLGEDIMGPLQSFTARVVFSLPTNGNAQWASYALTTL